MFLFLLQPLFIDIRVGTIATGLEMLQPLQNGRWRVECGCLQGQLSECTTRRGGRHAGRETSQGQGQRSSSRNLNPTPLASVCFVFETAESTFTRNHKQTCVFHVTTLSSSVERMNLCDAGKASQRAPTCSLSYVLLKSQMN